MGRRLADATKACRTRRTRGEIVLCFFLDFEEVGFEVVAEATGLRLRGEDALLDEDWAGVAASDWATAGCKIPSQSRKKFKTKNATAERHTQTLPTAES